jgi:hypothetical protein
MGLKNPRNRGRPIIISLTRRSIDDDVGSSGAWAGGQVAAGLRQ